MTRKGLTGGSYQPLTSEEITRINDTVLHIIEEIGCEVNSEAALEALVEVGATVDRRKRRVRFSRERALELIAQAPTEITLCGRDKKHDVQLGGRRVYTGTGGTALNIYEAASGETRPANLDDLKNIAGLVDKLDNIHLFLLPTYPNELSVKRMTSTASLPGWIIPPSISWVGYTLRKA